MHTPSTSTSSSNANPPSPLSSGLTVHEHLDFQRRAWVMERVAWGLMGVLLLLATLGVFATGPLASATRTDATRQLSVEYARFVRHHGHTEWAVTVRDLPTGATGIDLFIDNDLLREQTINQFIPEPSSSRITSDGVIYTFDIDPDALPGPRSVQIRSTIDGLGAMEGRVGVLLPNGNLTAVTLWMFAYP